MVVEKNPINNQGHNFAVEHKRRKGLTLLELLVVLGVVSLVMAVALPVLGKVRRQTQTMLGMSNQRQIVYAVNLFSIDNNGRYPESVATIGTTRTYWHWKEPTMMTNCEARSAQVHRSVSAYLRSYIEDASVMFCPSAPREYKYLQESWDAGDGWDNPQTPPLPPPSLLQDPVQGMYCFYWNYVGFLEGDGGPFIGPRAASGGRGQSRLLVSDYLGYDQVYSRNAYGSCEKFGRANITEGSQVSSDYWSLLNLDGDITLDTLKIKLHAGYTDGHVESYAPSNVVPMWVSLEPDGSVRNWTPGIFYLPRGALH